MAPLLAGMAALPTRGVASSSVLPQPRESVLPLIAMALSMSCVPLKVAKPWTSETVVTAWTAAAVQPGQSWSTIMRSPADIARQERSMASASTLRCRGVDGNDASLGECRKGSGVLGAGFTAELEH
jgi:hypothetical protein